MKKRILGFALILAMLIGVIASLPIYTSAAADAWDGTSSKALTGDGSKNSPYIVEDGKDMKYIQEQVLAGNTYNGKYIVLANDIDLGGKEWTPIGGRGGSTPFSGVFDGQGFSITGLSITEYSTYCGLFGVVASTSMFPAVIANLTVEGEIVIDEEDAFTAGIAFFVGGIIGYTESAGAAYLNTISNCVSRVNITINKLTTGTEDPYVGGINGRAQLTNFIDCVNEGKIDVKLGGAAKVVRIGGIVGANYNCTYLNTVNDGDVNVVQNSTAKRIDYVGGFIGVSATTSNDTMTTLTNCVNRGNITALNLQPMRTRVGGFIGAHYFNQTTIEKCYNTGTISGTSTDTAGIDPVESVYVGGITGFFDKDGGVNIVIVKDSYNSGDLIADGGLNQRVGGIVGEGTTYPAHKEGAEVSKIINCQTTTSDIAGYANEGLVVGGETNIGFAEFNALVVGIDAAIALGADYNFDDAIKYLDAPETTPKPETTAKPVTTAKPETTADPNETEDATDTTKAADTTVAKAKKSCGSSSTTLVALVSILGGACVFMFTKKKF